MRRPVPDQSVIEMKVPEGEMETVLYLNSSVNLEWIWSKMASVKDVSSQLERFEYVLEMIVLGVVMVLGLGETISLLVENANQSI